MDIMSNKGGLVKKALTQDGILIEATATSPPMAICRYCGGVAILRHRTRMINEGVSYYWRHPNNRYMNCRGRRGPFR